MTTDAPGPAESATSDPKRLAALYKLDLLGNTPDDDRFARITRIASRAFGMPIALVTLVDHDEQHFAAAIGTDLSGTSVENSFCADAIADAANVLVVRDALLDPRFAGKSIVTDVPNIRFYAGAPIVTHDGQALGTACVLDVEPREFSDEDTRLLRDIADLVQREITHTSLGMTDPLTGLANRRAFMSAAERFVMLGRRRSESVAVLFADINDLKRVNDRCGHGGGDALILRAAEAISRSTRTADVVARIGGDEFAVLLYDVDAEEAERVVAKIDAQIAADNRGFPADLALSMAMGVGVALPMDTVADIVERADAAMFSAKRASKLGAADHR